MSKREQDTVSFMADLASKLHDAGKISDSDLCSILESCINVRAVETGYADKHGVPFPRTKP